MNSVWVPKDQVWHKKPEDNSTVVLQSMPIYVPGPGQFFVNINNNNDKNDAKKFEFSLMKLKLK